MLNKDLQGQAFWGELRSTPSSGSHAPILLHFDVNKTLIQSDSIQTKTVEEGIREGIGELFHGTVQTDAHNAQFWHWNGKCAASAPSSRIGQERYISYAKHCREVIPEKKACNRVIQSFDLVQSTKCRAEMQKLLEVARNKMELPHAVRYTREAIEAGLPGTTKMIFPALFHLVVNLQKSKRKFAILFRSFGGDHETIRKEWNAFCEKKHPLYSKLLEGVGPLDGTAPGIPDRRLKQVHTMYRDEEGSLIVLDSCTNGPVDRSWDAWAREKPHNKFDTRKGRAYVREEMKSETVEGFASISAWMESHLITEATGAIKDDWAWWTWNGEKCQYGKLLQLFDQDSYKQLFFDDNVEHNDARIVDCRDVDGIWLPPEETINCVCTKVNPVEALLDDDYFLRKLQMCHPDFIDMQSASLLNCQQKLTEAEIERNQMEAAKRLLEEQVRNLREENHRIKLKHRIQVRDQA